MMANVTCSHMSHIQTAQDIFNLLKGPNPSYLVLNGNTLPIHKWDVVLMTPKGQGHKSK